METLKLLGMFLISLTPIEYKIMENNHSILNNYLVDFFNSILKIEETLLNTICSELSLREMHTIEAIVNSADSSVGSIAAKLKVTMGTLSVALKTLENKGYILREKTKKDRRQVNVIVTQKGIEINRRHQEFHHNMVDELISCLSAKELEILMLGLDKLNKHFYSLPNYKTKIKENNMKIKLTSDSTCDLTPELLQRYGVSGVIPMTVILGNEERIDGTFDPTEIYDFYKKTKILAKTSAINPYQFEEFFKEQTDDGSAVIHFSLSSELSVSYQNAKIAAEQFENVYIVDGRQLSAGTSLLLFRAREILRSNPEMSPKKLTELIIGMTPKVQTSYCLDNITYLYKGGRCSALQLFSANLLDLHPSIYVKDGANTVGRKYRGKMTVAISQYIEDVRNDNPDYDDTCCFIFHTPGTDSDIIDSARTTTERLFSFKEIFVVPTGSTITCHGGKNALGLIFMNR